MIHLRATFCCLLVLLIACPFASGAPLPRVTKGAAAGYVADRMCRDCHVAKYDSYQHVGMAQSFKHPANARIIEQFGEVFYHEPSKRYYQMFRNGDDLVFRRYQKDDAGRVINEIEVPVDWVLGSGNRTRSYLYQTDHGEVFQLPVGWYTEGQFWEMSPGFESANHEGLAREITRECMFCHNAFPEVEEDRYGAAAVFPQELPEGTGCQRCHGPGGEHVKTALTGGDLSAIRQAIVNPAKLEGDRRDSVCMQCHLLPAISIVSPVHYGRGDFSFRPGELLTDHLALLDVREAGIDEPERFEINHHGYRLMKSECYQEGGLTCIDCHDPHVKPPSDEFRAKVAGVCSDCHEKVAHPEPVAANECVTCHMPARRTTDVIHVTMTDHWIARGPFDLAALVAPVEKQSRQVTKITPLEFGDTPTDLDTQGYIAVAAMRANRSVANAISSLLDVLRQKNYAHYTPYLDLARAWLRIGEYEQSEAYARGLVRGDDSLAVAHDILGLSQAALGKSDQAKLSFRRSLAIDPQPEVHLALASVYFESGQLTLADVELDKAIELRPLLSDAFHMKGEIALERGNRGDAVENFKRTLEIDPGQLKSYMPLVSALKALGKDEDADTYEALYMRLMGG